MGLDDVDADIDENGVPRAFVRHDLRIRKFGSMGTLGSRDNQYISVLQPKLQNTDSPPIIPPAYTCPSVPAQHRRPSPSSYGATDHETTEDPQC